MANEWWKNVAFLGDNPFMGGINTLANKFGNNRNLNYNQSLTDWASPMGDVPDQPMMPPMLDQTGQMGASNYRGPQGISFNPDQGNIPYAPDERTGIVQTLKNWTTPAMAFMKKMGGVTPEKKAAYDAIMGDRGSLGTWQSQIGNYGGNKYQLTNTPGGLKVGSDIIGYGPGYEKNLYSAFGSKSLEEMEQKKLDWAEKRFNKLGRIGLGTDMYNQLIKSGRIGDQSIGDQRPGKDPTIPIGPIDTGGEPTRPAYTGPRTYDFDRGAFQRSGGQRASTAAGHTDPGKGSYGPHRAEGGRIGYQEGELVEDEYMAEATPGGMMEENIEEVQGEPSREQLEAIALEIFRLPLEQLNEEQLNVVYQAAMEQEPSEEEIQFAAQEGPGQGIASLV